MRGDGKHGRYAPHRRRRVLRPHSLAAVDECRSVLPDESVPDRIPPRIRSATVQRTSVACQHHGWSEVRSNGPREVERRRRQIAKGMLRV